MQTRAEITGQYAYAYTSASKLVKGQILDDVIAVTGWSRDNARRRLVAASSTSQTEAGRVNGSRRLTPTPRRPKAQPRKYSYGALKILQVVWRASGEQCGKYLAVSMETMLDSLERHEELPDRNGYYSAEVRIEWDSPKTS
jgi:hypothetical protein